MQKVSFADSYLEFSVMKAVASENSKVSYGCDAYTLDGDLLPGREMPEEVYAADVTKIREVLFCENPTNLELLIGDLRKLTHLEEVEFWEEIPEAFAIELQQALPRLKITLNQPSYFVLPECWQGKV